MSDKNKKPRLSEDQIDMLSGAFSGMVATGVTYPLDTLSVQAQSGTNNASKTHHMPKGTAKGAKKLYKGIGWKLGKTIPAGAAGYWGYGTAKRKLNEHFGPQEIEKNSALKQIAQTQPGPYMQTYAHEDEPDNVGKKNMQTGRAIDALAKEWINRRPPKGVRKEFKGHRPMTKEGSLNLAAKILPKAGPALKSFAKGAIGVGKKSDFKKPSYWAGGATTMFAPTKLKRSKVLENYGQYSKPTKFKRNFNKLPSSGRVNTIK